MSLRQLTTFQLSAADQGILAGRRTMPSRCRSVARAAFWLLACLVTSLALAACQQIGPDSLGVGRQRYNDAIHETSRQQLFANLIRIANGEWPLFMDVTEVDAAEALQGSLTGGASGIGGKSALQGAGPAAVTGVTTTGTTGSLLSKIIGSAVGSIGGTVGYQESPTIRYQPLVGNALIQQISTPMTAESIANLITSDWPFLPLLDLTTDSLTPQYEDNWAALNAIAALYEDYGALTITAGPSDANKAVDNPKQVTTGTVVNVQTTAKEQQGNDALVLYLQPRHPNIEPILIHPLDTGPGPPPKVELNKVEEVNCAGGRAEVTSYTDVPGPSEDPTAAASAIAKRNILHLWIRLLRLYEDTQVADGIKKTIPPLVTKLDKLDPSHEVANAYKDNKADAFYAALDKIVRFVPANDLDEVFDLLPRRLELRTAAVKSKTAHASADPPQPSKNIAKSAATRASNEDSSSSPPKNSAPVMTTHSALGTLIYALSPAAPGIEIVTPAIYKQIFSHSWNVNGADFYTLLYSDLGRTCESGTTTICYRKNLLVDRI
jgi:hypothetical protein